MRHISEHETATNALALLARLEQLNRDYIEAIALARREAIMRSIDERFYLMGVSK